MTDLRLAKLANLLVRYSTALKKGETVLLDLMDTPDEFGIELMRAVRAVGAIPLIETRHSRISREIQREITLEHARLAREIELFRMRKVRAYIAIRGSANANESSDVPGDQLALFTKAMRPLHDYRVNKTRWVVLRWPSPSMAQAAGMSTEAFENLYFQKEKC